MHDMFWQPTEGELVRLKPGAAAKWPFEAERGQPFVASLCNPALGLCWITPEAKDRRWHSSPIQVHDLVPANRDLSP